MFPAADGFVTIPAHSPSFFAAMCTALEAEALGEDPRFADAAGFAETRGDVTPSFGAFAIGISLPGITPIDQMDAKRDAIVIVLLKLKVAFEQ